MSTQPTTITAPTDQQPSPVASAPKPTEPTQPTKAAEKRDASTEPPLGESGIKALQAERSAREALERELKPLKEQMDALKGIFGDKKVEGTDIVSTLQQQVAAMQHDSLVERVARRHNITDDNDVEFLRHASSEDAMTRLAQRLKVPATPDTRTPSPDPAQGAPAPAKAAEDAEYEAYFPPTPKQ